METILIILMADLANAGKISLNPFYIMETILMHTHTMGMRGILGMS